MTSCGGPTLPAICQSKRAALGLVLSYIRGEGPGSSPAAPASSSADAALLEAARFKSCLRVRSLALEALCSLPSRVAYHKIFPFRDQVRPGAGSSGAVAPIRGVPRGMWVSSSSTGLTSGEGLSSCVGRLPWGGSTGNSLQQCGVIRITPNMNTHCLIKLSAILLILIFPLLSQHDTL